MLMFPACPQAETNKGYVALTTFGLRTSRNIEMKIFLIILIIVVFVVFYPLVNKFMTQVVFNSKKRTRKILLEAYRFYKKEYPDATEKELLLYTMQASFLILKKQEYPNKPYSTKPKSILTEEDINELVEKAVNIRNLIQIVIEKGLSPDTAL